MPPNFVVQSDFFKIISSGNSPSSKAWYTDNAGRPVQRLQSQLKLAFPLWNVSLPSDSSCILTATKNVVGRFLNQVDDSHVCSRGSSAQLATGVFVHIEQVSASRAEPAYNAWSMALNKAFEPICDIDMKVDDTTISNKCEYA